MSKPVGQGAPTTQAVQPEVLQSLPPRPTLPSESPTPIGRPGRSPARATLLATAVSILGAVVAVVACALVGGRSYVSGSIAVVLCSLVPFLVRFESRRLQARELVTVAVMAALAVASRAAFAWAPGFKPIFAVIMVAGVALGPSSGFFVGAVSALASNFLFGQGPWTPWQMLGYGLCGFVFGLLGRAGILPQGRWSAKAKALACVFGFLTVFALCGPVLDTSSLFFLLSRITPEGVAAVYLAGAPVNAIHGAATAATLFLIANPLMGKLQRLREKYGVGE